MCVKSMDYEPYSEWAFSCKLNGWRGNIVSPPPPSFSWGDWTFQYFAKLGKLKNFENSWEGWLSLGGSKIARGDEPLYMQNKILDPGFTRWGPG